MAGESRKIDYYCSRCSKLVRVPSEYADKVSVCPVCGTALLKRKGTGDQLKSKSIRTERVSSVSGWLGSVVFHSILLLSFTGITWFSGFGTGSGDKDVGIVPVSSDELLESASSGAITLPSRSSKVMSATVQQTSKIEPIKDLGVGSLQSSQVDEVIGVELNASAGGSEISGDWSSFAASGGEGASGGASFFGLEAKGGKFVYVVDHSGSMGGQKLLAAKSELIRSVSALERGMEFFIIFYDTGYIQMPSNGLVRATEQNKRKYFSWVEQIGTGGGTDPRGAMQVALSLKPDAIFLLSDGLFSPAACDAIRLSNPRGRSAVHTVAFYDNAGETVLMRIAEENRGQYRFVGGGSIGITAQTPGTRTPVTVRPGGRRIRTRTIRRVPGVRYRQRVIRVR